MFLVLTNMDSSLCNIYGSFYLGMSASIVSKVLVSNYLEENIESVFMVGSIEEYYLLFIIMHLVFQNHY